MHGIKSIKPCPPLSQWESFPAKTLFLWHYIYILSSIIGRNISRVSRNLKAQNLRRLWKTTPDWKVVQTKTTFSPIKGEEIWKRAEWAVPQSDEAAEKSGHSTDRNEGHEHEQAQKIRIVTEDHQPNVELCPDQRSGMRHFRTSYSANLVNK